MGFEELLPEHGDFTFLVGHAWPREDKVPGGDSARLKNVRALAFGGVAKTTRFSAAIGTANSAAIGTANCMAASPSGGEVGKCTKCDA